MRIYKALGSRNLRSSLFPFENICFKKNLVVNSSHNMAGGSLTPIIVGVGDVVNRSLKVEDAIEPMKLMLQATYVAINDTTSAPSIQEELRSSIDGVSVVATWTWPYVDLPGLISQNLGVKPTHKVYSKHGGNQPIKLVDEAARRIAQGESKVAIVTGGEALASRKWL